ncbi:putative glycosyltransferase [Angulomicrobium tetraedrale]|uniref:Putative glycosyltransferase n=1 Tax=Ancylobacter tetraedralis TaxID=217068 RepID=A0A839ZCW1_9HYPH|nr:glycosyltransferase [Ancylobacter tetraedralis]MBB3772623.1 putative glycosyltransferase [Ancylobacter tetraedralis]
MSATDTPAGTPSRVLIVVTHLLGVGHLARMAAVGRAMAAAGMEVTIASGGRVAATVDTTGCHRIQLPPVHCVGTDFRTLYAAPGLVANAAHLAARRDALIEAFDTVRPDALLTELYPFGRRSLAAEFDALLAHARAATPRPVILASIRDVLNPPSTPEKAEGALATLATVYDGVLFHGAAALVPLSASWPVPPALERRLIETGYVHDGARTFEEGGSDGTDEVIVSGGGSAAGLPLARHALAAAGLIPERQWRLLVGSGVPAEAFATLEAEAPANMRVERTRPDFPALLARAALSISQAGYNTVLDLAAAKARAILVPFAEGAEREQTQRAGELARRGLVRMLAAATLTGAELAAAVRVALGEPRPDWSGIGRDGAARTAAGVEAAIARRRAANDAFARLEATLARARTAGRTLAFWWRDDDAVAPTPALEALLAARARWAVPLSLAVIPARATPALAERLAGETQVDVLLHGWAHANHAPAGEKKAEFGAHRPLASMIADIEAGRARLDTLFGTRVLPVFVPPWNRIAPELVERLPALGIAALSTYKRRPPDGPAAPLRLNTHWDPIDWRAGGGLVEEAGLLDGLVRRIEEELASPPDVLEPIGLLTHHLVHDGWIDRLLGEVMDRLLASGTVRFISPRVLLAAQAERR